MGLPGNVLRLTALTVVTLVGAGACALGPQRSAAGVDGRQPVAASPPATGASASPGPTKTAAPSDTAGDPTTGADDSAGAADKGAADKAAEDKPAATGGQRTARPHNCPVGRHQIKVERYLDEIGDFGEVTVDGEQSAADCKAIKKFQRRYGISPASGRAGPTTLNVARRLASSDPDDCRTGKGLTICIDLTAQTVWAMRGGKVVFGPTVTRTGMAGYHTPAGTYRIGWRNIKEWSDPYEVWLPYWQQFNGGIGFHETTTYLHNGAIGSHGCVNLLPADARELWDLARVGSRVNVFGRRAGT